MGAAATAREGGADAGVPENFGAAVQAWLERAEAPAAGWLGALRAEALSKLQAEGLPTGSMEPWRACPPTQIVRGAYSFSPSVAPGLDLAGALAALPEWLRSDVQARVVVVDGALVGVDGELPAGWDVASLAEPAAALEGRLGASLEGAKEGRGFGLLNTAAFGGGAHLSVKAGAALASAPVALVYVSTQAQGACFPRSFIECGAGAEATLLEVYLSAPEAAGALTCAVTEVELADGAILEHLRLNEEAATAAQLSELSVRQGRDSRYNARVVSLGGQQLRLETRARLEGQGASCDLEGLYYARAAQRFDHRLEVEHLAPDTSSEQRWRGLIDDEALAAWDGMTLVRASAPRASGHQQNRNLLLSEQAVVHTKPHLEIDVDEVTASHGATVGQLDAAQIFYLQSRGLDAETARAMLTFAFVREIIDSVRLEGLRARVSGELLARLPGGDRLQEAG